MVVSFRSHAAMCVDSTLTSLAGIAVLVEVSRSYRM